MGNYRTATFELRNTDVSPETVLHSLKPILRSEHGVIWQGNLVAHISARPDVEEATFAEICASYPGISRCARYDHNDTVSLSWATLYQYDESLNIVETVTERAPHEEEPAADGRRVDWNDIDKLRRERYSETLCRLATPDVIHINSFAGNDAWSHRYGNPTQDPVTAYLQIEHGFHTIACFSGYMYMTRQRDPWQWEVIGSDV